MAVSAFYSDSHGYVTNVKGQSNRHNTAPPFGDVPNRLPYMAAPECILLFLLIFVKQKISVDKPRISGYNMNRKGAADKRFSLYEGFLSFQTVTWQSGGFAFSQ